MHAQFVPVFQHRLPISVFPVYGQHHAPVVVRQGGIGIDQFRKGLAHGGPRREINRNRRRAYRVLASCETFDDDPHGGPLLASIVVGKTVTG